MNGYSTLLVIHKKIFFSFPTHLISLQTPYSHLRFFQQILNIIVREQEEGFERTTAAAMTKNISVTKKALILSLIKPSRMYHRGSKMVTHYLLAWRERPWI
ncbi:hypothetical protein ES288_A01G193700v1 [Gossypium darwinii]|uniref:Uncharacterized protein n=1 Tax=Gossypium darwinii TaxID=34276 RepID=A0A5D2HN52_GOSDA|nr:hypothetical protein ES288_A01G193700v1 [Gossypium darwinii]